MRAFFMGNRFWEAQPKTGRPRKFESPEQLWAYAIEYFEWVEDNPLVEQLVFHAKGEITKTTVNRPRAMTVRGLCVFLGIGSSTFDDYRNRKDFTEVCNRITETMNTQKYEGAAVGFFAQSIVARDLGLNEKPVVLIQNKGDLNDFYAEQSETNA